MDFKLDQIQGGSSGLDAFFSREPEVITPTGQKTAAAKPQRLKVASLAQLNGFVRISNETLVHKSTQDFWSIAKDKEGFVIERLVNNSADPLKV